MPNLYSTCRTGCLALLLLLGLSGAALGQTQAAPDTASCNKIKTLLWRISGAGLPGPSYVFGTMHVLCPDDATVPPEMEAAFRSSGQLVLELDLDDPAMGKQFRRAAQLPWPNSLRRLLKPRDFKVVKKFFRQQLHHSILPYVLVKPALTEALVYSAALPCTPVSYEGKFLELAKAQQKEVLGLETIEQQLVSMQQVPYRKQAADLVEAIRTYDSIPRLMQHLVVTYRGRDVDELYRLSVDPKYGSENDGPAELQARNQDWIPKMSAWIKSKPTFFAVGAAHLGGGTGVLQLLRQQGYQIEPVLLPTASAKSAE
ncbi:TraB/GumN family protein [Microvirga sp. STR05]|uniref:TraB/GumN family protein n=1 Tax=Hymenobacter duratus TaxID=2771356 RepID=A0ABR8JC29_9BACT|nr:TraB/GumN family protein [Hymenobacter duratus]MBD2714321.1 TraB/GumN family protein [Hymenobacter duratus]MBR7949224.1 TraB/GumN family protein [Microvirga sp. STR05]